MSRRLLLFVACFMGLPLFSGANAQSTPDGYVQGLHTGSDEAARGQISAAKAAIESAIALDPAQPSGWYELGSVLGQAGDFSEAEAAFRHAIALKPDMAKAHYGLALTLVAKPQEKLDWTEAIAQCREALKSDPNYSEALVLLGTGLQSTGDTESAIRAFTRAIQLSPSQSQAHFHLAESWASAGKLSDAENEYRAAISITPDYAEAYCGLGKLLLLLGESDQALQTLDKALQLNPDLSDSHYALARTLQKLHREQQARVEFAEAKELIERPDKGIESAHDSNQALELAAKGDTKDAIATLRKAIVLKPDYGIPHYNLGLILADTGDMQGASEELKKAISLMPGQSGPWFDLGRVQYLERNRCAALADISWAVHLAPSEKRIAAELSALQAEPKKPACPAGAENTEQMPEVGAVTDTAPAHLVFAKALEASGDIQGAVGELLRSLSLNPLLTEARSHLANAYALTGNSKAAELEYNKLLLIAPEDASFRLQFGRLLLSSGAIGDALDQLKLAVKFSPESADARAALKEALKAAGTR